MIDWPRVKQLRDEVGAGEFGEVVQIFLDEVQEVIQRLQQDTERREIEQNLHFLKGSAVNLGFETFSKLCQDGERMSAAGEEQSVDLNAIITAFAESRGVFQSQLARHV